MNLLQGVLSIILSMTFAVPCVAATVAPSNVSVARVVEGRYENRNIADGSVLGTESFRLTVHRDGSRCLLIWSNSASRGTQITSQVCVDSAFRPTEAYARYWIGGSSYRHNEIDLGTGVPEIGSRFTNHEVEGRVEVHADLNPCAKDGTASLSLPIRRGKGNGWFWISEVSFIWAMSI